MENTVRIISTVCLVNLLTHSVAAHLVEKEDLMPMSKLYAMNNYADTFQEDCTSRIYGGRFTKDGEAPYQASIAVKRSGVIVHICGGGLITRKHILTAAHCFFRRSDGQRANLQDMMGIAGTVTTAITPQTQMRLLYKVWVLQEYKINLYRNDLSVAEVRMSFDLTPNVNMIRMGTNTTAPVGHRCMLSGFGKTPKEKRPQNMSTVCLPIIENEKCIALFGKEVVTDKNICAGIVGKDSCRGDSGSPLVCNGEVTGIVSYGPIECGLHPAVYTKVSKFQNSILLPLERASETKNEPSSMLTLVVLLGRFLSSTV